MLVGTISVSNSQMSILIFFEKIQEKHVGITRNEL